MYIYFFLLKKALFIRISKYDFNFKGKFSFVIKNRKRTKYFPYIILI